MRRSEHYIYQREMLEPVASKPIREIELDYISTIQIDVPRMAAPFMRHFLNESGERNVYEAIHSEIATYTLDNSDCSDNRETLQYLLIDQGIPHTFYLQDDDDHWRRADYRMCEGEFMCFKASDYSEVLDTYVITSALEQQAYTALMLLARRKQAAASLFDFTEEDIAVLKPKVLKAIVES